MKPIARWNPARDVWEVPDSEGLLCEHLDVFSGTFPTSGMTVDGSAYELPTWASRTDGSASSFLPTPAAADGMGGPGHSGRQGGLNLRTAVSYLPQAPLTPSAGI